MEKRGKNGDGKSMKTAEDGMIHLKGGVCYITHEQEDAFHVLSGKVLVYIVPWVSGKAGRRSLLCEMEAGRMIPAFSYRDMDYHSWRFCLTAAEEAEIQCLANACTEPLKKHFLSDAGIPCSRQNEYGNILTEHYRLNLVKEDGYFIRTEREEEETEQRIVRLILSAFRKESERETQQEEPALYRTASLLCRKAGISIAPYERIKSCCGQHPSLEEIARLSHFPLRKITLEEDWQKADAGLLLVFQGESREPAACVPRGRGGYVLYQNGRKPVRLSKEIAETCDPQAFMIYRPFPRKEITGKVLAQYCLQCLHWQDIFSILLLTGISSLIGLLLPTLTQRLYDTYIPIGAESVVLQFGFLIAVFMLGNIAFSVVKGLGVFRLCSHIRYQVQSAMYYRIFELPENFLRKYESADLAHRVMETGGLAEQIAELCLSLSLGVLTACFYLLRMFSYSIQLSIASLFLTLIFTAASFAMMRHQILRQTELIKADARSASVLYQFIQGIEKVRMAGMETRALYEYMKPFIALRKLSASISHVSNLRAVVSSLGGGLLTVTLYVLAYQSSSVTTGQFAAFAAAFGVVSQTISTLAGGLAAYEQMKPAYERIRPLLETEPENSGTERIPGELTGRIDIDHLSFSYGKNTPPVLQDLSIHIKAGEYIGIVGPSGCGKSTLLRLLLGLEQPDTGKIYYDNQDMSELDLQELRRRFGVVLQDGNLISGSIYDNIALTAPSAGPQDVKAAVRAVGLSRDIQEMPMGLHTAVNENGATISGGQKQRILIARAILNRPRILFLDEATSALDNITQSMVSDTLEHMDCTRIVIAHRLSTIQHCDRILVFSEGKIVEEGDFASLMLQKGLFHALASRQMV